MQITRGNFVSVANSFGINSNTAVVFNAATYGARPDNATDSTSAINGALAAAAAAGGGVVTLGAGVYRHTGIAIPAGVTLRGAGHGGATILRNTHATNHSVSLVGTPGGPYLNGAHLSDVTLDATAVRGAQAGINALLAQSFTVDRVDVKAHGVGVFHKASWECFYTDVHVLGCTIGWYFPTPAPYTPSCPITITASHAVECGQALRIDDGVEGLSWNGGDFTGATVAAMVLLGNSTSQLSFTGINFEGGSGDDIYFGDNTTGPTQVTFTGCRFFQQNTHARSVWFQRGGGLAFVGCKWTNYTKVIRQESTTGAVMCVSSNATGYTTFLDFNGTTSDVAPILMSSAADGISGLGPSGNERVNSVKAAQWAATRVVYGADKTTLVDADFTTPPVEGATAAIYNLTDNTMRWAVRHYDTWLSTPPLGADIVIRDSAGNVTADSFIPAITSTATAAGTTTLTAGSTQVQVFTGTTTQTVVLPGTGVAAGQAFTVINNSTASLTVQPSGGGTLKTVAAGGSIVVTAVVAAPTAIADWYFVYGTGGSPSASSTSSAIAQRDSRGNLLADAFIPSSSIVPTAAATSVQTIDSNEVIIYTGTTTQTHQMPTTSVAAGYRQTVVNTSTGGISITASAGGAIVTLSTGVTAVLVAVQATPTLPAHWAVTTGISANYSTGPAAGTLAQRNGSAYLSAAGFIPSFNTQASAGGSTNLTASSSEVQEFTGTLSQNVFMPTTSVPAGQRFTLVNSGSNTIAVFSSNGGALATLNGNAKAATFVALAATPTTAAHWVVEIHPSYGVSQSAGASTLAMRDGNANLLAANFIAAATTTAASATPVTLTLNSASTQIVTGSANQTFTLPSTGVPVGLTYLFVCEGTGSVTVNGANGAALITFGGAPGNAALVVAKTANAPANSDWVKYVYDSLTRTANPNANTVPVRNGNASLLAVNFIPGFLSTVTSGGTLAFGPGSGQTQVFTGTTTHTAQLPTTSVPAGQSFSIINTSTGAVTVNSSGGNLVKTLAAGASTVVTALQATPTTAAHWFAT